MVKTLDKAAVLRRRNRDPSNIAAGPAKNPIDDAPADETMGRSIQQKAIQDLQRLAIARKNPLYVWEAILRCLTGDIPLPDWCLEYIKASALGIWDIRESVSPVDGHTTAGRKKPSADQLQRKLSQALQFTQQGKSAFEDYERVENLMSDAHLADARAAFPEAFAEPSPIPNIKKRRRLATRESAQRHIGEGRALLSLLSKAGVTKPPTEV